MAKKKKQAVKPIENVFKTNGTRRYIESSLVSEADIEKQLRDADTILWVLGNTFSAISGAQAVMAQSMLGLFKKWGYHGSNVDNVIRNIKKYIYVQETLIEGFKPCYKDNNLQPITIGNLQAVLEELFGMMVGVTVEGKYCSSDVEVAYIPKTLVGVVKSMPVANQIEWLSDHISEAIADGNKYMEEHHITKEEPEIKVKINGSGVGGTATIK